MKDGLWHKSPLHVFVLRGWLTGPYRVAGRAYDGQSWSNRTQPGLGMRVIILDRHEEPLVGDLGIAAIGQAVFAVEVGHAVAGEVRRQRLQESEPFLSRPSRWRGAGRSRLSRRTSRGPVDRWRPNVRISALRSRREVRDVPARPSGRFSWRSGSSLSKCSSRYSIKSAVMMLLKAKWSKYAARSHRIGGDRRHARGCGREEAPFS